LVKAVVASACVVKQSSVSDWSIKTNYRVASNIHGLVTEMFAQSWSRKLMDSTQSTITVPT